MVTANRSFKLSMIALMLAMPSAFCIRTWGQEVPAVAASNTQTNGAPDDWSFHHLVFSNPGTREDAVKEGRLDQWLKITADRRYQMQLRRRSGTQQAVAEAGEAAAAAKKTKTPLKKDWSTTLSGAVATLTGTVGTLSSSSISGSSTLTVDGVTLSASAPTSAMSTGTFSGLPTSTTAPTITVSGGGPTITLTTNATAKTATGTITAGNPGAPLTGQTIVIPSNAGSITLTPGGNPATLTGSVSAAVSSGTIQVAYNNGGGTTNTLSLTPTTQTQGKVVGTFTASGTSSGQFTPGTFTVTSGSNTATFTPNGYQYFTISGTPRAGDTVAIDGLTYTFTTSTPSGARSVATGASTTQAAQNLAAAVMADPTMCATSSCFGSGTTQPTNVSASYDTAAHTYIFNSNLAPSSFTISDNASSRISESLGTVAAGSDSCSASGSVFTVGFAAVATASGGGSSSAGSMATALNLSGCANLGMTATNTALTVTVTNTAFGTTPIVSSSDSLGGFGSVATQGTGTAGCTSSTTGTFGTYSGITVANQASNIAAAISSCNVSYAAVGATVLYTSGNTMFTLTAAAPGSAVTLSGTGPSGISWTPTVGNDTSAGTCTTGTAGTFVNSGVANTLANNIYTVLKSSSCTSSPGNTGVTATYSGSNTFTVTANVLGGSPTFTTTGSTATIFTPGSVSGGNAGSTTCTGTGPWTATFMTGTTTTATAANLTSAITQAACSGASSTITATGGVVASTAVPGSGASLTVGASSNANIFSWSAVTAGTDGTNSSTTFAYWSVNTYLTPTLVAANIASAINANPTLQVLTSGVSATSSGASVKIAANAAGTGGNSYAVSESNFSAWSPTGDLSAGGSGSPAARVQPNAYPAKFSFYTDSANCSDFVVYPTGVTGSATNANIIAYNNLYVSGCSGANPSAFWAYNTGGAVSTSPILSFDSTGSQVAYIQVTGTTASLVILKWAANPSASVGTPLTLTATSNTGYRTCTAPCYAAVNLGANDTFSSPFYDYSSDTAYVGDDAGNLHAITGVFNGTPTLDAGSIFPVNLGSKQLSSPVADPTWVGGQVFVGDLGGVLHCVNLSTGAVTATGSLGTAIADSPLINSSANYVIAFAQGSTSAVYGFSEQFFPGGQGGPVSIGAGGSGNYYQYAGTFDNAYYDSSNATGNIYVLGNTGVTTGATLYRVALSGGFLTGAVTSVATGLTASATNAFPWPSPVTEFCNNGANACALQTVSGCTLNSSTTITCSGGFTSGDVGASVTGTDIPAGATVSSVTGTTKITISTAASGNASGVSLTIGATSSGTDYIFFSVNRGTPSGCTSSVGNGCVLAYNVSYPGSVSEAGTGLPVSTPGGTGSNGCWATGGLIIDNSATSGTLAGGSQVYFVNLDANAAGNSNGVTSGGCTSPSTVSILDGVQAAQSSP